MLETKYVSDRFHFVNVEFELLTSQLNIHKKKCEVHTVNYKRFISSLSECPSVDA